MAHWLGDVDSTLLGREFHGHGAANEKARFPVCNLTNGAWSVTNEEERVEPGGRRWSLSAR